jgi:hypothetical protein
MSNYTSFFITPLSLQNQLTKRVYAILIKIYILTLTKGGNMATVKKATCAAKTTKGKKCKNPATGKSKYCVTHKKN